MKKKWFENAVTAFLVSVVITTGLGFIPKHNYSPGAVGRGVPLVWYVKFGIDGAVPSFYFGRYLIDFALVLFVVVMVMIEIYAIKRMRKGSMWTGALGHQRKAKEATAEKNSSKEL